MSWRSHLTSCAFVLGAGVSLLGIAQASAFSLDEVRGVERYAEAPSPENGGVSSPYGESAVSSEYGDEALAEEPETGLIPEDKVVIGGAPSPSTGGNFTGAIPELADLERRISELESVNMELRSDLDAQKKKDEKKESLNDPFKLKFTGMLNLDGTSISSNDEAKDFGMRTTNDVNARNVMIILRGTGHGHLEYSVSFDLNKSFSIYNAYLRVKDTKYFGDLTIGQHFVESGMESCTVTNDRVFATLDEDCGMYRLSRRVGISSTRFFDDKKSRVYAGVYVAPSIASVPNYVYNNDPGIVLATRLTRTPIREIDDDGFAREIFQVGASYFHFLPGDDASLRLRNRGLMWIDDNPYFYDGKIPLEGRSYSLTNFEAEYQHGEFGLTGEGYICTVTDGGGTSFGTTVVSRYFLTPHVARKYTAQDARFTVPYMPEDTVFLNFAERTCGQHWGAFEAVAKWEWNEANNLQRVKGAQWGSSHAFVAGLNWFWNDQTVWMFDWEHSFVSSHKATGEHANPEFDTFAAQLRFKF